MHTKIVYNKLIKTAAIKIQLTLNKNCVALTKTA